MSIPSGAMEERGPVFKRALFLLSRTFAQVLQPFEGPSKLRIRLVCFQSPVAISSKLMSADSLSGDIPMRREDMDSLEAIHNSA